MNLPFFLKKYLIVSLIMTISGLAFGQNSSTGKAFSDGIWTLVGASNGVELYTTHIKYSIPDVKDRFIITVYGKVVNTTESNMISSSSYGVNFRYIAVDNRILFASVGLPVDLKPKQTIVKATSVTSKVYEIRFGDDPINPLVFNKK